MSLCEITKEDKVTRVSVGFKTHTITDEKKLIYSIHIQYGVSIDNIKECNPKIPRDANGDLIVKVNDVINIPMLESKGSTTIPNNGQYPKSKSSSCAPWMKIVLREKGVRRNGDDTKNKGNSRIEEYLSTASLKKGSYDYMTSWCGGFVNWVMLKSGYNQTVSKPAWALNWCNFGKKIASPVYGAIGVKTRITKEGKEAGHVSFVIGISEDGKDIFMLGGNQGGASILEVKRYSLDTWNKGFYFPSDCDERKCTLEVYRGYALPKGRGD